MTTRVRMLAALLCVPLFVAACGGGGDDDNGGGSSASPTAEASPTSETAGQVLLEEDFAGDAGAFQTATDANVIIEPSQGLLSFFIAGLGKDPNIIRSAAPLSTPADAISVEVDYTFTQTYGVGDGGWALRCISGENSYLFTYELSASEDHGQTFMGIWEVVDGQVDEVTSDKTPEGGVGPDGTGTFTAVCNGAGEGAPIDLSLSLDGEEILSGASESGIGTFDSVGLGGEYLGEKIGAGEGAMPGGIYFSADNVRVEGL